MFAANNRHSRFLFETFFLIRLFESEEEGKYPAIGFFFTETSHEILKRLELGVEFELLPCCHREIGRKGET